MSKLEKLVLQLMVVTLLATGAAAAQTAPQATNSAALSQAMVPADNASAGADRPALQHRYPRYQVSRDDVLSLTFPLVPEFNQKVTVQPDGYITLQNVGSVYILGQTVPEVVETLKKTYAKVLHDPMIDVDLVDFQKPYFMVSGQVGKPGQYELRHDTTVSEAVAIAGGFLPTAKTQVFVFHRISSGWMEVKKLSLKDVLNGKNINEDIQMQPGDMIFVPEKFITNFKKYVPYTGGIYTNPAAF
ncbi:MAG: polysaccharide biosynthesis/export family protein [Candidatus Acidiferrum sp.]